MAYRVGLLLNARDEDPVVKDLTAAEELAKKNSIDNNGAPFAVWDEQDKTVTLYAGYEEFKPTY